LLNNLCSHEKGKEFAEIAVNKLGYDLERFREELKNMNSDD
jgi:hypothetical protein